MEIKYSSQPPTTMERNGTRRTLNYNIHELSESEIKALWDSENKDDGTTYESFALSHKYSYNSLTMGNARWTYNGIVEAIIREKYSIDQMEAITNNMAAINAVFMQKLVSEGILEATKYLKESINDENSTIFKEMQQWRAMAKSVAKEIIKT